MNSKNLTSKMLLTLNNYLSVNNSIELEFFSLSAIVIYKNLNILNLSLIVKKLLVIYLFKLYN